MVVTSLKRKSLSNLNGFFITMGFKSLWKIHPQSTLLVSMIACLIALNS